MRRAGGHRPVVGEDDVVEDALKAAVRDIERHAAAEGWDRRPALFALVRTSDLVRDEPELAGQLGLAGAAAGELTPVAQEVLAIETSIPDVLVGIDWPDAVVGAALVLETIALPDDVEDDAPGTDAGSWAAQQPRRQEARLVIAVLRDGTRAAALRWRSHDHESDVLTGPDLAPTLSDALAQSLK
jgi:hypothetical protein